MAAFEQLVGQMGADESGSARDQNMLAQALSSP
jgi:hypothetical protein